MGRDSCFLQRTTSFSHVRGDAFQIFYCISFEALFIIGVHAVARPVVAVEVFRGSALATSRTLTITRAFTVVVRKVLFVVLRVTRPRALTFRRQLSVALAFPGRRRRRRGRDPRATNVLRAPAADVALLTIIEPRRNAIRISRALFIVAPGAIIGVG